MDFSRNNLAGKIPMEVGFLVKLIALYVGQNSLIGAIPPTIGNLTSLEDFRVLNNNLEGHVLDEIGCLRSLRVFEIVANSLSVSPSISKANNDFCLETKQMFCAIALSKLY
ncbi:hypothetical protein FNV43_RR24634 [Rhamnella rubrinervis]|uniref:Uncharacterized protein n=1 Tax=Rhamnella rubrinervis TaxID=2594499 RepID=A0A8K0DLW6_9ROSA|nr:hypothetical protein FNV43_RR24634 [Rhamnella rubrinervis]